MISYFLVAVIGFQVTAIELVDKKTCLANSKTISDHYSKDKRLDIKVFCLPKQIKE
jgi:hypothetical protein